jgi:hypothetical protein
MMRSYRNFGIIGTFIGKRYQSVANVALKTDSTKTSINSEHIRGNVTNKLEFIRPENYTPIPIYQVLDSDANIKDQNHAPDVSYSMLKRLKVHVKARKDNRE